jgi:hypothetical protein
MDNEKHIVNFANMLAVTFTKMPEANFDKVLQLDSKELGITAIFTPEFDEGPARVNSDGKIIQFNSAKMVVDDNKCHPFTVTFIALWCMLKTPEITAIDADGAVCQLMLTHFANLDKYLIIMGAELNEILFVNSDTDPENAERAYMFGEFVKKYAAK